MHMKICFGNTISMIKCFVKNFLLCGFIGWCLECLWTGLDSIRRHTDRKLLCRTSLWMFPIYGLAACLTPICSKLHKRNALCRGGVYALLIYLAEYVTGVLLKKYEACPWDYSKSKLNVKGVIRLDYAPVWFFTGLLFERVLGHKKSS